MRGSVFNMAGFCGGVFAYIALVYCIVIMVLVLLVVLLIITITLYQPLWWFITTDLQTCYYSYYPLPFLVFWVCAIACVPTFFCHLPRFIYLPFAFPTTLCIC